MEKNNEKKILGPELPPHLLEKQKPKRVMGPFIDEKEYDQLPNNTPSKNSDGREEWMVSITSNDSSHPRLNYKELQKNVTSFSRKGVISREEPKYTEEQLKKLKERDEEYEKFVQEFNKSNQREKSLLELHLENKMKDKKKRKRDEKDSKDKEDKKDSKDKKDKKKKDKKKKKKKEKEEEYVPFFDRERDIVSGYNPSKKKMAFSEAQFLSDRFSRGSVQKYL